MTTTLTEKAFNQWISQHPESGHPLDNKRFHVFVKTVCTYRSKKWNNTQYLQGKILEHTPSFDRELLERILIRYEHLIAFNKTYPLKKNFHRPKISLSPSTTQ